MLNPRPTAPGQLPPQTEGFTFYNLSSGPVQLHAVTVKDSGGNTVHGPVDIGPVASGETKNVPINPGVPGAEVSCLVKYAAGGTPRTIQMSSQSLPANEKISYSIYGVRDTVNHATSGEIFGWGVDILDDGINLGL